LPWFQVDEFPKELPTQNLAQRSPRGAHGRESRTRFTA
jgi:hypothetical protein